MEKNTQELYDLFTQYVKSNRKIILGRDMVEDFKVFTKAKDMANTIIENDPEGVRQGKYIGIGLDDHNKVKLNLVKLFSDIKIEELIANSGE